MTVQHDTQHPQTAQPQPPYPPQTQPHPGRESRMNPRPDYGEHSYTGANRLTGKKALITGGDSGIGRAVAVAFAREGADVLISYLDEDDDTEETLRVVRGAGRTAIAAPGDITNEHQCQSLVQRALRDLGGLDILVNCAGFQMNRPGIDAEHVKEFGKNTPTGRAGQPVEIAPVFVFLASSESSYITGEVIGATGGRPLG